MDGQKRYAVIYVSIDYEEFKTETYKGCTLRNNSSSELVRINTNQPELDFELIVAVAHELSDTVICFSSCDHYFMDIDSDITDELEDTF